MYAKFYCVDSSHSTIWNFGLHSFPFGLHILVGFQAYNMDDVDTGQLYLF